MKNGKGKYMKFININKIKSQFKKYINAQNFKRASAAVNEAGLVIREKISILKHHIDSGSFNAVTMIMVITISVVLLTSTTHHYNIVMAEAKAEASHAKIKIAQEETKRVVAVAKIRADAMIGVAHYQARTEEARAAKNPYIAAAEHSNTPVNVYINDKDLNYVINTSDGATEIAISTIHVKGKKYTPEQRKLMTIAFYIGKEIGYPETIQSLLLQETRAGAYGDRIGDTNLPIGKRSYGVMQMKVATARKVLRKHPALVPNYFPNRKTYKRIRDEEIIIKLIQDDEFNIRLATLNFEIHRRLSNSWALSVVAYNTGQGAANHITKPKEHIYYGHILNKLIKDVRPFNKESNLTI